MPSWYEIGFWKQRGPILLHFLFFPNTLLNHLLFLQLGWIHTTEIENKFPGKGNMLFTLETWRCKHPKACNSRNFEDERNQEWDEQNFKGEHQTQNTSKDQFQ